MKSAARSVLFAVAFDGQRYAADLSASVWDWLMTQGFFIEGGTCI
jgi:hypothetical protein